MYIECQIQSQEEKAHHCIFQNELFDISPDLPKLPTYEECSARSCLECLQVKEDSVIQEFWKIWVQDSQQLAAPPMTRFQRCQAFLTSELPGKWGVGG